MHATGSCELNSRNSFTCYKCIRLVELIRGLGSSSSRGCCVLWSQAKQITLVFKVSLIPRVN